MWFARSCWNVVISSRSVLWIHGESEWMHFLHYQRVCVSVSLSSVCNGNLPLWWVMTESWVSECVCVCVKVIGRRLFYLDACLMSFHVCGGVQINSTSFLNARLHSYSSHTDWFSQSLRLSLCAEAQLTDWLSHLLSSHMLSVHHVSFSCLRTSHFFFFSFLSIRSSTFIQSFIY